MNVNHGAVRTVTCCIFGDKCWYLLRQLEQHQSVTWPNGKALDYESRDCRFDPCRDLFVGWRSMCRDPLVVWVRCRWSEVFFPASGFWRVIMRGVELDFMTMLYMITETTCIH